MPNHSMKRRSRWTTLRSATRRGHGGASPTDGRNRRRAVPPDLDGAAEAVEAVENFIGGEAGESGRSRVGAAAETAWSIHNGYADAFPWNQTASAILEDFSDRLSAIVGQVDALDCRKAIGR